MSPTFSYLLAAPQLFWFWTAMVFALGLCIGSFLNVCVWRLPRDESLVSPSSHCPSCGRGIRWHENIPVLSWLCLRARCAGCGCRISPIYPAVELLTAILFVWIWWRIAQRCEPVELFLPRCVMVAVLIATVFIDAKHFIIPDELTYGGMVAGLVFAAIFPAAVWGVDGQGVAVHGMAVVKAFAGLVFGGGMMAVAAVAGRLIFKQEALGWGDVKLMAAIGSCLGSAACLFTVFVGSLVGSIAGLGLIAVGRGRLKTAIPFGPYLAVGGCVWMLYGPEIVDAYFRWSRLFFKNILGVG